MTDTQNEGGLLIEDLKICKAIEDLYKQSFPESTKVEGDAKLHISNIPTYSMMFWDEKGNKIGTLDWSTGEMRFTGNISESAKIFFGFLKPYIDDYIKGTTK